MIAALFVQTNGAYFGNPEIDPWDIKRDARNYAGPHSVVAHPPCSRWCRLAGLVEARWHGKTVGKKKHCRVVNAKRGEDDGCFASALASVRKWGGVLEHPAFSDAWPAFALPRPSPGGGWQRGFCGGWSCHIEQGRYGHPAKKATWLYVHGTNDLPQLRWGSDRDRDSTALVSWCGNHTKGHEHRPRVGKAKAAATPPEFRALLLALARII